MSQSISSAAKRLRVAALGLVFLTAACDPLDLGSFFENREEGGSILSLLETDGRDIDIGDEVEGALSASDWVSLDGSYLEAWELEGREGQSVSVDLISDDFDAYLYVVGPGLSETLRDDDDGGACHARINFTVLESGDFTLVASSNGSGSTGTYRLRVSDSPQERPSVSCGGVDGLALTALETEGRVRRGQSVGGRLTGAEASIYDERPVHAWTYEADAGERATIQLRSDDFDAYLYVFGPGMTSTETDDDGGADLNSELTVTFPQDGTYTIGAGALGSGSVGAYTLSVVEPLDLGTLATNGREIRVGQDVSGVLTSTDPSVEGRISQAWALDVRAGTRATVELLSEDFDGYLTIAAPGLFEPLTNDDGGDGLNSRLDVTFPEDGVYRVIAQSYSGSTGAFTLRVR